MDAAVKFMNALSRLIGVCVWPVMILVIALHFSPAISGVFDKLSELSVKGPAGLDIEAKLKAAAALGAATVALPGKNQDKSLPDAEVAQIVAEQGALKASNRLVLWVDDAPENNKFERQALSAYGITFDLARSTEQALEAVRQNNYAAIISDMNRAPDAQAGFKLLSKLGDIHPPFIIYSSDDSLRREEEAVNLGAVGSTNNASTLFAMVLRAVGKQASGPASDRSSFGPP